MSTTANTTMAESGEKHGGKWMTDLRPEMPVSEAAKATLRRRLEPVWKWSGEAATAKKGSTKAVHQLRVAVRRAMSVMQGYAELLPHKK
jgi:CHAD domain-containing protein